MSEAERSRCGSVYQAPPGLESVLAAELDRLGAGDLIWVGPLAISEQPPASSVWALDIWAAPERRKIASIGDAASVLRGVQRNWALVPTGHFRRANLISERLPPVKAAPLVFPQPAPASHLGAWTLLETDELLYSPTKTSPFPSGVPRFVEDREGPPSRAYLKLWEACTRLGRWPQPGETCVDLGSTPGGWTWAIAQLGASVTAVDRAPLAPQVAAMPGVTFRQESAFGIDPVSVERVDWLFSDVIAYPERLLALVRRWIEAGRAARIVMSVKFQGETDFATMDAFAAIPGATLAHLWHNKHEVTFFWADPVAS
ncbi:methyltransferase [Acetobacter nitrogenifigens DSM 23921 = NBRC 105050]|uniref:Methyltransferase n=1 Tax=Acetobacter nitrogenifigens DSM 23921 = NBRC 105050 TaxID=1120919 RepID=A0A511XB08_9PROT|nr:SAM-dependent methyltransferase [Acetobacter nitrogenifigens]GBQ90928.1 methyltransferase [Acetobacter nitrogenifigens DSM 23921 = NBRC 105050]GEN60051.1 methyltransferase [Acetobacter nitrogenifigens DSM 23921 = NBRC 105050]